MNPRFSPDPRARDVFGEPWVRLWALRFDLEMARWVARYHVHVTFALSPAWIASLQAYDQGAMDRALELSGIPAILLTDDQKREIYATFRSIGRPMTVDLPRYRELATKPLARYSTADWRDLQVLANVAWFSPSTRLEPGMAALIRKGRNYSESDKQEVLAYERSLMGDILPTFALLDKIGRIEIAACPLHDPILPLLIDSDAAKTADPALLTPQPAFAHPQDVTLQIKGADSLYRTWLGHRPVGLWPGHGAVSQALMPIVRSAGVRWVATGETILSHTLGIPLRSKGRLVRPDLLTGLWRAQDGPVVLFGDTDLAHRIGSVYPTWNGHKAARDFVSRLDAIAGRVDHSGPHLLTLVIDGERTWQAYPDGGRAFLETLYRLLRRDPELATVTPSMALSLPWQTLPRPLHAGTSVKASLGSWIGQPRQNSAWRALAAARRVLGPMIKRTWGDLSSVKARDLLLQAEDGAWFERLGARSSGPKTRLVDRGFRNLLTWAYRDEGLPPPQDLRVPFVHQIIPASADALSTPPGGKGRVSWLGARTVVITAGKVAAPHRVTALQIGHDSRSLYLAADFAGSPRLISWAMGVLRWPGGLDRAGVDFPVQFLLDLTPGQQGRLRLLSQPPRRLEVRTVWRRDRVEIAIPWVDLGVRGGEDLAIEPLEYASTPVLTPPLEQAVPLLPSRLDVEIPRESRGSSRAIRSSPGSADSAVENPLTRFAVMDDGTDWGFVFHLAHMADPTTYRSQPVFPTLDVYLSTAGATRDPAPLLPGRQARSASPWCAALTIHGFEAGLYLPQGDRALEDVTARVIVDPSARTVTAEVPKRFFRGDPRHWRFLVGSLVSDQRTGILPAIRGSRPGLAAGATASFADLLEPAGPVATGDPVLPWAKP